MDQQQLIRTQTDALRAQLGRLQEIVKPGGADTALMDRVRVRLTKLINDRRTRLDKLDEQLQKGGTLAQAWTTLKQIREDCESVFSESLAFVEGLLSRSAEVDGGLCALADALLAKLSKQADISWDRFTILGEGEYWGKLADVIRLRFPEVSIWSLPIAAHEYGHFVGPRIRAEAADGSSFHPLDGLRDAEWERGLQEGATPREGLELAQRYAAYLDEDFADVLATYAVGPAYLCACVLLRFDLRGAHAGGSRHASAAKRVHLILDVLDRMDGEQQGVLGGPFRKVSMYLRDAWTAALSAAGEPQALAEPEAKAVEARGAELYELLRKEFPALVYDRWWKKVPSMAERLADDVPASKKPEQDDELVDLLNASWMARMNDIERGGGSADHVRTIGERAMSIGAQIAARKG